jgi:hypothetical protein
LSSEDIFETPEKREQKKKQTRIKDEPLRKLSVVKLRKQTCEEKQALKVLTEQAINDYDGFYQKSDITSEKR